MRPATTSHVDVSALRALRICPFCGIWKGVPFIRRNPNSFRFLLRFWCNHKPRRLDCSVAEHADVFWRRSAHA